MEKNGHLQFLDQSSIAYTAILVTLFLSVRIFEKAEFVGDTPAIIMSVVIIIACAPAAYFVYRDSQK